MYRIFRKEFKPYRAAWLTRMLMNDIVPAYYETCITMSIAEDKLRKLCECIEKSRNRRKNTLLHLSSNKLTILSSKNHPYMEFTIERCSTYDRC